MSNIYGTCSVDGCDRPVLSRGWCRAHYKRWARHGDPLGGRPSNLKGLPPLDRLLARRTIDDRGCWVISGADADTGYARIKVAGRNLKAHRWAYEHFVGPIPDGLTIDHLCRNRACANPEHLEAVDQRTNTLRGEGPTAINARKSTCVRGHSLDEAYVIPATGSRMCLLCQKERAA